MNWDLITRVCYILAEERHKTHIAQKYCKLDNVLTYIQYHIQRRPNVIK